MKGPNEHARIGHRYDVTSSQDIQGPEADAMSIYYIAFGSKCTMSSGS